MNYSFDIEVAQKYGVEEAIVIANLQYWIAKNRANKKHFKEERTWTYNSITAFSKLFPFWSFKQVRRILESLRTQKVIRAESMSEEWSDRTYWYAFENETEFLPKDDDVPKWANEKSPNGQMSCAQIATSLGTDNKPYKNTNPPVRMDAKTDCKEVFAAIDKFWNAYPRKVNRVEVERAFVEANAIVVMDKIMSALKWQCQCDDWCRDGGRYIPTPGNYLRDHRWLDEEIKVKPVQTNGTRVKSMDEGTVYDCL